MTARCLTVVIAAVGCLLSMELALRLYHATGPRIAALSKRLKNTPEPLVTGAAAVPLHVAVASPVLYGLNPEHPDVNALGLRDDETTVSKPDGIFRILVLGDSVAFGLGVSRQEAFPKLLQAALRREHSQVEVLNGAVSGYSPYNELQFYLTKGRELQPDVVIVQFCMNDVVNPRLHWNSTKDVIMDIPDVAIPNLAYDRDHALPALKAREDHKAGLPDRGDGARSFLEFSQLYQAADGRIRRLLKRPKTGWDTQITGEDDLSIQVLMDDGTPEWRWLTGMYSQLNAAITRDGARFVLALFPLAYQLDVGYPFLPQERIASYCETERIVYVDLLPVFRKHRPAEVFRLTDPGYHDIWHLTRAGHEMTAEALASFLKEQGLASGARQ